jgi:hypothetical protein
MSEEDKKLLSPKAGYNQHTNLILNSKIRLALLKIEDLRALFKIELPALTYQI